MPIKVDKTGGGGVVKPEGSIRSSKEGRSLTFVTERKILLKGRSKEAGESAGESGE